MDGNIVNPSEGHQLPPGAMVHHNCCYCEPKVTPTRSPTRVCQSLEVRLLNPVFEGDTVYSRSEVLEAHPSGSRKGVGVITVRTSGFKQDGPEVISLKRAVMVYRAGKSRQIARSGGA